MTRLYGQTKLPTLCAYTRVDRPTPKPPPPSPITADVYRRLTLDANLPPRSPFAPFDYESPKETPGVGTLLGIDAEFVSLAPAVKEPGPEGEEIVVQPVRLGLARVSVVRGDPDHPRRLVPVIDDYIRAVEPVHDYLTRFSGLVPGDLDPATSKRHIVKLKHAYLKLRYLIDAGCVFVGHGLKQDFKMINVFVPPAQIVDTVELFHFKRQRKLSLRFLASYLLGADIQKDTHDSIEDARTAVRLYEKYLEMREDGEGAFREKLLEIYRFGKQHGFTGEVRPDNVVPPPPPGRRPRRRRLPDRLPRRRRLPGRRLLGRPAASRNVERVYSLAGKCDITKLFALLHSRSSSSSRRVARGVVTRRRASLSLVGLRPFVDGGCREIRPPRRRARPPPSLRALHAHPRRRGVVVSSAHAGARHRRRHRGAVRDVGVRRLHLPVPHLPPAHQEFSTFNADELAERVAVVGGRSLHLPTSPSISWWACKTYGQAGTTSGAALVRQTYAADGRDPPGCGPEGTCQDTYAGYVDACPNTDPVDPLAAPSWSCEHLPEALFGDSGDGGQSQIKGSCVKTQLCYIPQDATGMAPPRATPPRARPEPRTRT